MGFAILAAMNTSLLLVAHGSRREASNDEVRALTTRLRAAADGRFHQVDCAFLELASPLIPDGLVRLIQRRRGEKSLAPSAPSWPQVGTSTAAAMGRHHNAKRGSHGHERCVGVIPISIRMIDTWCSLGMLPPSATCTIC